MENRKAHRVVFERGYAANMMAIDGTWRRPCTMVDVSETGAKLTVDGSIEGLNLKEFFPAAFDHGKGIPALPTSVGQWRSGWRLFPQARRQEEKTLRGRAAFRDGWRCLIRTPTPRELRSAFNNRHHDRHILGA